MIKKSNSMDRDVFYTDYEITLMHEKQHQYLQYAPYYILEKALSKKEVAELNRIVSKYDSEMKKGAVVGSTVEQTMQNNYRNSDIFFIRNGIDAEFEYYNDKILSIGEKVNEQIFNLDLNTSMDPQYTVYSEGMHFDWHPDGPFGILDARGLNCIPNSLEWRKLTCVTALTDGDAYEGGDFQIINPSSGPDHCIHTIRMDAGSMIFFPAYSAHKVLPVTKGIRKTLVHWFCGPRWR